MALWLDACSPFMRRVGRLCAQKGIAPPHTSTAGCNPSSHPKSAQQSLKPAAAGSLPHTCPLPPKQPLLPKRPVPPKRPLLVTPLTLSPLRSTSSGISSSPRPHSASGRTVSSSRAGQATASPRSSSPMAAGANLPPSSFRLRRRLHRFGILGVVCGVCVCVCLGAGGREGR